MSALTDRIAREHEITVDPTVATESGRELYHCACGVRTEFGRPALLSDEQYHEHLIEVTEAAVREQIAAELHRWAAIEDERCCWSYAEIWQEAAEIARGEA